MTVAELIRALQAVSHPNDTTEVVMSRDAEGNGFRKLGMVDVTGLWDGDRSVHPDDACGDEDNVVVLWPK